MRIDYTMTWFDQRLKERGLTVAELFGDNEAILFMRHRSEVLGGDVPVRADNNGHDCDCEYCPRKSDGHLDCLCGKSVPLHGEKAVQCKSCKMEFQWNKDEKEWYVKQDQAIAA